MEEESSSLDAVTDPSAGLIYVDGLIEIFRTASMRVAMIERGGQPMGTALLVGPDLLLTAAHVLGAGTMPPPIENVRAVFDFRPVPEMNPAEVGIRIRITEFLTGSLPSDDEVAPKHLTEDAPEDRLDFALVRLAHPVPDVAERGHFSLDPAEYDFSPTGILYIFQHPLGSPQMVSATMGATRNAGGTRVRYRANTMRGSSGSPVIDMRGRLVAVHHYSTGNYNQGVPASRISRAVAGSPSGDVLLAHDQPGGRPQSPQPGDFKRLERLGRYQEAAEMLNAYAAAGDQAAAEEVIRRLRGMGRFDDAARLQEALPLGPKAVRAAVAAVRLTS